MDFNELINDIKIKLTEPLPGSSAHIKLAPYRKDTLNKDYSKYNPKLASTLLLFYPSDQLIKFVLIQRPDYSGTHSGQISFPGGKKENNESLMETAIRETQEEIGILARDIKILGKLSLVYVPPSNFLITPYIGFLEKTPTFKPDPIEVTEVLEIDLNELLKKDVIKEKLITVGAKTKNPMKINVPYLDLNYQVVWGATGVILSEFRDMIS
tara:strand:- start:836 stop:1468 length:633 start_codon:yes stop_codon:yes gene_type:complete